MSNPLQRLDARYLEMRTRLHTRYAELSNLPDASRLAYLRGPEHEWDEGEVAQMWEAGQQVPEGAQAPLNHMYVHVPFCKSICSFCNYERLRPSSPDQLQDWLNRVLHSIEGLAPAARSLTFHTLYIGGGTPSVLPPNLLSTLLDAVDHHFSWHPDATRHFEFDPAIMNESKLDVLTSHGFTQFSFGIQTLNSDINSQHNRGPQTLSLIARRFEEFSQRGIHSVSCDFLAGLAGTTPDQILSEIETVLTRFQPGWIDVFMVTPTHSYIDAHFGGSFDQFYNHLDPFQRKLPKALETLAREHHYVFRPGQGHHLCLQRMESMSPANGTRESTGFSYCQLVSEQQRPLNLLGLGPSSRSQIFGVASFQTQFPTDSEEETKGTHYVGHPRDMSAEAITYLTHYLRDNDRIDRALFRSIFGADIADIAPVAIAAWTQSGIAQLTPKALRIVPHDRQTRTRHLLWLVPDAHIEHEIAQHMRLDLSPGGIQQLFHPLHLETRLADRVVLASVTHGGFTLRLPNAGSYAVRIAPGLEDAAPPRLLPEALPKSPQDEKAMRRALGQLKALIARNHEPWVPM